MNNKKFVLSENLKSLSAKRNIRPTTLANRLNINKSTIHNYFNGVVPQSVLALCRIAHFFDISVEELIFNEDQTPEEDIITCNSFEGRYEMIIKKIKVVNKDNFSKKEKDALIDVP